MSISIFYVFAGVCMFVCLLSCVSVLVQVRVSARTRVSMHSSLCVRACLCRYAHGANAFTLTLADDDREDQKWEQLLQSYYMRIRRVCSL